MGAITEAMARACRQAGVEIRTGSSVREVIVTNERAAGVVLESSARIEADAVVSNINPRLLYGDLVAEDHLPPNFQSRIQGLKCGSGTFRMNVALGELPNFSCLPSVGPAEHHGASIIIAPSLKYLDQCFMDARQYGWSRRPSIDMQIPSLADDTLAPPGRHVASLFRQHFAPDLPDGSSWDEHKEQAADLVIVTITSYAPNFKSSVIGRMMLSPLDLERKFALPGGDIFHGALTLDQLHSARPALGYGDYRAPVENLYMCGSGTDPGGGVTGAPGHNAAQEIIRDMKSRGGSRFRTAADQSRKLIHRAMGTALRDNKAKSKPSCRRLWG